MSQAFHMRVSDMGRKEKIKKRGGGITTLVCESQRALSLIRNQNLVSWPCSASSSQKAQRCRGLTTMPRRLLMTRQLCKELQ